MSEHKIPDGSTHYEGCWQDRRHHDCALGQIAKLEAERDALKLEAEIQAQEARGQRATVHEIYRIVTDGKGEPGDWNGAAPVREAVAQLRAALARMQQTVTDEERWRLATWMSGLDGWDDDYRFTAEQVNDLLAARAAGKGE